MSTRPTRLVVAPVLAAALLCPCIAGAAGLELPERGAFALGRGGAAISAVDDPSAVDLNPGALSRLHGGRFLYSHELLWSHATFKRAASSIPQDANVTPAADPSVEVQNGDDLFPLGVSLAATHDFGLPGFTFGLSLYGPHGAASSAWPVKGGQRYMVTGFDGVILFPGVSVAYGTESFGIGVTLQAATLPNVKYRLVVDGIKSGPLNPLASSAEVEATVTGRDPFAPTAIVGTWYRPVPEVEIALSGRAVPVVFHAEGHLKIANVPDQSGFTPDQLKLEDAGAKFDIKLPPTARLGLRYRHLNGEREVFDVELDGTYEAWSIFNQLGLDLSGEINLYGGETLPDVKLEKRWRDTLGARLGGSYAAVPERLWVSAGAFVEQGAVPPRYEDLDFMSFARLGLGTGVRGTVYDGEAFGLTASMAYMHVFQEDRTVSERDGKVFQQRPLAPCPEDCGGRSGVPANAGHFTSSFDQLGVTLVGRY